MFLLAPDYVIQSKPSFWMKIDKSLGSKVTWQRINTNTSELDEKSPQLKGSNCNLLWLWLLRLILFINSSKELSNLLHLDIRPPKNQRLTKVNGERNNNNMFPLLKLLEPWLLFFGNSFKSFVTYPVTYFPHISTDYRIHSFSQIWNSCNVRLCNSGKYVTTFDEEMVKEH